MSLLSEAKQTGWHGLNHALLNSGWCGFANRAFSCPRLSEVSGFRLVVDTVYVKTVL